MLDINKSGGMEFKYLALLLIGSALFSISKILNEVKILDLSQSLRQFFIKFLSSKLNIRFYNKLSKEAEDFKDLCDKYTYI